MSAFMETVRLQSDWYRVGAGLSVRFSFCAGQLDARWHPRLPTKREAQLVYDRYRKARDTFLTELAVRIGGRIVCVEPQW